MLEVARWLRLAHDRFAGGLFGIVVNSYKFVPIWRLALAAEYLNGLGFGHTQTLSSK